MPALGAARALVVSLLVLVGLAAASGEAAAHGEGIGPEAHVPRVLAIEPAVPGLAVTVIEAGARLRLDNGTGLPVTVLPTTAPPTTGLAGAHPEHAAGGHTAGGHGAGPAAGPVSVAPGDTARWTDARVKAAAADPVPAERSRAWLVPVRVGDQLVSVRGEQIWPEPPASAPWWLATAAVAVLTGAVAVRGATVRGATVRGATGQQDTGQDDTGRGAGRAPGAADGPWAPALAALTVLVAAAHLVHVVGSALVIEERSTLAVALGTAGPAVLAWVLAPLGAALTLARRPYGPLLCALAGGLLALVGAFTANNFGSPVLPFAGPAGLDRAAVALTLGGGLGLFTAGFAALRAVGRPAPAPASRAAGCSDTVTPSDGRPART